MNDFHVALLWLLALELVTGRLAVQLTAIELDDLFIRYRSPYKA